MTSSPQPPIQLTVSKWKAPKKAQTNSHCIFSAGFCQQWHMCKNTNKHTTAAHQQHTHCLSFDSVPGNTPPFTVYLKLVFIHLFLHKSLIPICNLLCQLYLHILASIHPVMHCLYLALSLPRGLPAASPLIPGKNWITWRAEKRRRDVICYNTESRRMGRGLFSLSYSKKTFTQWTAKTEIEEKEKWTEEKG